MSLEITGKVIKILDKQSGESKTGKTWQKQEFVIKTEGEYPKTVCLEGWGTRADTVGELQPGAKVKVSFEPQSREYNDRYYTTLNAYKIETL